MSGQDNYAGSGNPTSTTGTLFTRAKLYELVNSVVYGERLDPPVEYALLKIAETFVAEVSTAAADLARHRHSHAIETRDIQLYLEQGLWSESLIRAISLSFIEREWDMALPGFVDEDKASTTRITHPTVGHQTRTAHATRAATAAAAAAHNTGAGSGAGHQSHHAHYTR